MASRTGLRDLVQQHGRASLAEQPKPVSTWFNSLSEAVFAFDLIFRQSSNSRDWAATVGDGYCDHDLIGARRVIQTDLHPVEVAAHEGRVFVAKRNVEYCAETAALL